MPFTVSYVTSIHRAQGLEYKNVKLVITDDDKTNMTHDIFYTAITRAKENLEIFWNAETQKFVIDNFEEQTQKWNKEIALINAIKNNK
ncbi:ATP-binding domain-containing protein [Mesoplasma chauliocola]|uniref:ATP-binding domain-containing protein n=1 Tax=Mesoplasma chauliocola TaxID=216427 RepID=UPI0023E82EEC|nr:ATP-binding domain-containing protein [Mesoplasma chauliocola]